MNVRVVIVLFLTIIISSCSATKEATVASKSHSNNTLGAQYIADLSSDKMHGRVIGTEGIELAASYLEQQLAAMGISPYFSNSYRDTFIYQSKEAYNIVAEIKSNKATNEYIIISAHYDHVQELPNNNDSIYNGANDNASGVAAVLEIGRMLQKNREDIQKNVLLVLFSGEEVVLKGSKHLAAKLKAENFNLAYVINFEMIGVPLAIGNQKALLTGFNMSNMPSKINTTLGQEFIILDENSERLNLFTRSDNYPFYQQFNVPSHTISTFAFENYDYYHHVDDEIEALDLKHVEDMITLSGKVILKLLKENTAIELNK
ncbi:MAG: M20/M25/M40 family metallo-hydrolase [Chitinophagales bacterium]